jgi:hypothetical protein
VRPYEVDGPVVCTTADADADADSAAAGFCFSLQSSDLTRCSSVLRDWGSPRNR